MICRCIIHNYFYKMSRRTRLITHDSELKVSPLFTNKSSWEKRLSEFKTRVFYQHKYAHPNCLVKIRSVQFRERTTTVDVPAACVPIVWYVLAKRVCDKEIKRWKGVVLCTMCVCVWPTRMIWCIFFRTQ